MKILQLIKDPTYFLITFGAAFVFFDIQFYFMKYLPGTINQMCVMGANFTTNNIIFSIILSILMGLCVAGFFALMAEREQKTTIAATSLSGIGALVGSFTVFCPVCTIPIISLFGISLSLQFFVDHNILFKGVSLAITLMSLYLINAQLNKNCIICAK